MDEIELGDKVRCKYTGFVGIAIYKTEFVNGCVQFGVAPKIDKDNKMREEVGIDSESLEVVSKKRKPSVKRETGGPNKRGTSVRGY